MHHGTPRPTRNRSLTVSRPFQSCRPRPPSVRLFFPSPAPTSKRWVIAPCHPSAPVFALRSAFYCSFQHVRKNFEPHPQFFRASSYQLHMRSSEAWRELQKSLVLIRGRVTVLRGWRSSTLCVDIRYVNFRTIRR